MYLFMAVFYFIFFNQEISKILYVKKVYMILSRLWSFYYNSDFKSDVSSKQCKYVYI